MEAGGGGGGGSARRRSFSDNRRDPLAGLTLNAVLGNQKGPVGPPALMTRTVSRTLLDIIRDEEPNSGAYKNLENHHNNKKSWKIFRDRLRLRRAGAAWASSVHTPTSDVSFQTYRSQLSRNESTRMPLTVASNSVESAQESTHSEDVSEQGFDINNNTRSIRPQMMRRESTRISTTFVPESTQSDPEFDNAAYVGVETVPVSDVPIQNSRSQIMRRNSSRLPSFANRPIQSADGSFNEYDSAPSVRLSAALAAEREQIQRVVSSAEAGAAATENETEEGAAEATAGGEAEGEEPPVRMSLMDLLEETDRQMGWSSYAAEEEEEEEEEEGGGGGGGTEYTCCVCMVRHKGAAFIPCGHTFCRLCSRELWVSRGNCPLCNGFILEILDIF